METHSTQITWHGAKLGSEPTPSAQPSHTVQLGYSLVTAATLSGFSFARSQPRLGCQWTRVGSTQAAETHIHTKAPVPGISRLLWTETTWPIPHCLA